MSGGISATFVDFTTLSFGDAPGVDEVLGRSVLGRNLVTTPRDPDIRHRALKHGHERQSNDSAEPLANRFGFRGEEAEVAPGQIATIGDSFTFGWGSNLRETWQYKLEQRLSSTASPMKVYNLGRPGSDPDDYLEAARSYVPFLKPKIVVV